jgi:hypothetical protein
VTSASVRSAQLEIQPADGSGDRRKISAIVHSFADQWLTLIASERLAPSTAVGVECDDMLFIGEVLCSMPSGGEGWAIEIKVAQTLTRLHSLMVLRAQLELAQIRSMDLGRIPSG